MVSAILAGGENTRYPIPKGFIEVGGEKLIEKTLRLLRETTDSVLISTNTPERYFRLRVPLVGDVVKSSGPMAGIFSVFLATGADNVFFTACDMPFLKPGLVRYIIESHRGEATVPVFRGRPEPLAAVYSKAAARVMEEMLMKRQGSLTEMLSRLSVRVLEEAEWRKHDPEGMSFCNINTPEDYERAFGKRPEAMVKEG